MSVNVTVGQGSGTNVFESILAQTRKNHLTSEATLDPVNKIRVVEPENIIDTDFEYGLQPTKWETLEVVNNIPTFYFRDGEDSIDLVSVESTEGSYNVKVTTVENHGLNKGAPIIVVGTKNFSASGTFTISRIDSSTVFWYRAKYPQTFTGSLMESNTTFLYPGRLFQGIYIQKDIQDIVTNEQNPSTLTVTTKNPHGMGQGTFLVVTNSSGTKKIYADASRVNHLDTTQVSYSVAPDGINATGTGYTSRNVNPYDFESKKAIFFQPGNVDVSNNSIVVSEGHGVNDDTYLMYKRPVGDSTVGGLEDFTLYKANCPDATTLKLRSVRATITAGSVEERAFGGAGGANFFNDFRRTAPTAVTFPASISKSNSGDTVYEFIGYLLTSSTSVTIASSVSGTGARVAYWFGKVALRNLSTNYTSDFLEGQSVVTNESTAEGDPTISSGANTSSVTFSVTSGAYYAFRVRAYANRPGGGPRSASLTFTNATLNRYAPNQAIAPNASTVTLTSNGTGLFGLHALHKAYPVTAVYSSNNIIQTDVAAGTTNATPSAGEAVMFVSDGFGVLDAYMSTNNVSRSDYSKYLYDTVSGGNFTTKSTLEPTPTVITIADTSVNGICWTVPARMITELDSIYIPSHGLNTDDQVTVRMTNQEEPPAGLSNNTTYFVEAVSPSYIRLKETAVSQTVDIKSLGSNVIGIEFTTPLANANTIFLENHNFIDDTEVTYDAEGETAIPGLVSGNTYIVANGTSTTFKLKNPGSSTTIDLTGTSANNHSFSALLNTDGSYAISQIPTETSFTLPVDFQVPARTFTVDPIKNIVTGNTIYAPSHVCSTGSEVYFYESNASATSNDKFYVIRKDTDYLQLAGNITAAQSGAASDLSSFAPNIHTLKLTSITGEFQGANANITAGSVGISTPDTFDFLSLERVGDDVDVEVRVPPRTLSVASVSTNVVTTTVAHGLADGDHVFYAKGAATGTNLTDGRVYYVNSTGPTTLTLHESHADLSTPLTVTAGDFGTLNVRPIGTTYTRTVGEVHDPNNMSMTETFPVTANTASTLLNASYMVRTLMFPRADGFALHRPYDGGVELVPSDNPDGTIVRQTRRYFRYQSGKGICLSKAVNFNAPNEIETLSRNDLVGTIVTRIPHRIKVGVNVEISGSNPSDWDGTYTVTAVSDLNTFSFDYTTAPTGTAAGGFPRFKVASWSNCVLRAGLFDDQNGMFYEYDGSTLYAVRRSSIRQLFGTSAVEFLSNKVSGTNTSFTTQLTTGDFIVIKGQTYKVIKVANNTTLYISPPYRGETNTFITMTKTVDTRVPQNQWSVDACDGNGPSGFLLDTGKIQMMYIDYSWYGAGKIRFGFKGVDGKVIYCHEFLHNNQFTEAYMRSGNLPARYEVSSQGTPTYVPSLMHWGTSIIMDGRFDDDKAYLFTASGTTLSFTGGDSVDFTGTPSTTLVNVPGTTQQGYKITLNTTEYEKVVSVPAGTVVARATGDTGATLPAGTVTVGTAIRLKNGGEIYVSGLPSSTTSTAFTAGDPTDSIPTVIPLVSVRLAPSVDNNLTGPLGNREIINRMQLILKSVSVLTTHDVEVKLLLNAYPYSKNYTKVTKPSLSQLIAHPKKDNLTGGVDIYTISASGGATNTNGKRLGNNTIFELGEIVTLGNSILGGDDVFPNGPDLLTIAAYPIDNTGISINNPMSISARISWTESQA